MSDDIDVQYTLDPSGYLVGINQIDAANQRAQASMAGLVTTSTGMQRALSLITPQRATIAGLTLLGGQAAQTEQQLSGLSATSTVTGVNVGKLGGSIRQTARDMPVGFQQARALTEQYTKMGVAGAGSENRIAKLVKTSAQLGGATGEGPGQLAQGLVELSRATGNQNLDPARFSKLSDSLTTVSAKMGASATSTLAFSKSIAPMAQNAGIGATGILGISAAFSRLGEDGIGASTAVNKMLSDMNRAVREGSPEMKTYAQIAGMTADQFERLYKANPTEALTQVTEQIARAGSGGPRMLEQLGIEGVRGQRSLQALVASGGLRPAIAEATAAYGSGSTQRAAEAAYSGLSDELTELKESASQLGEAFGRPLLAPLTSFTKALQGPTSLLTRVTGSGAGQTALTTLIGGAGLLMGARSIAGPLGVLALGRQAATSGPGRGLAAGLAAGLGMAPGSRTARYGAYAQAAYDEGRMGPVNTALYEGALGFGARWRERNPRDPGAGPRPGLFERARTNLRAYGYNAVQSYTGAVTQGLVNARMNDPFDREASIGFSAGASRAGAAARDAYAAGGGVTGSLKEFHAELKRTTGTTATFRQTMGGFGSLLSSQYQLTRQLGRDAGSAVGRGARTLGRAVGPEMLAGLGVSAAIGAYAFGSNRLDQASQAREAWGQSDIAASINAYRESIGKATSSTQTFTSMTEGLNKTLAKAATVESARMVTEEDKAAAAGSRGKITRNYAGSEREIAAQILAQSPGGLAPDELQAIKVDLLRQMGAGQAQAALNALPSGFVSAGEQAGASPAQMQAAVRTLTAGAGRGGNWLTNTLFSNDMSTLSSASNTPGWLRAIGMGAGSGLHRSSLDAAGQDQLKAISEGIAQQQGANAKYGANYAAQEQLRAMNAALKEAYESGNADVFQTLSQQFGQQLGGTKVKDKLWDPEEFRRRGFDFSALVAGESEGYSSQREELMAARKAAGGYIRPELQLQPYVADIRRDSLYLGQAFDPRLTKTSDAARAVQASLNAPEDVAKQSEAVQQLVNGAEKAGKSMEELALQSARAAQKVAPGSGEANILAQTQARAEQMMARQQAGMTTGAAQMQQYRYVSQLASMTPTTPAERQQQEQARVQAQDLQDQMRQRMVQRLMVQRQADISASRSAQDFAMQTGYAREDFGVQRERSLRNFRIGEERSRHQYQLSVRRSEEDFYTSRNRALRDFNISMQRGEEDFYKARSRQVRDFNIGLKRQIEDAAASLYDPYARIQTKATYDAGNLMLNLREQTEAMAKQKSQLDALREMGLSSQSIDILGLGKTENAQQLNNLMADATTDPRILAQLNQMAKQRQAAAGGLVTDESNKDLRRQREDLAKALKDSNEDYAKSVERAREDLAKGLADSQKDFRKALARNATDFAYNLSQSRRDLNTSLSDMESDFARSISRQKKQFDISMSRMREDVVESDKQIAGSFEDLAEATNKAIHGQAVNWQKLLKNDTKTWVKDMKTDVIPQLDAIFSGYGVSFKSAVSAGGVAKSAGGGTSTKGGQTKYGEGGHVDGYSPHPKADNIDAKLTAGEFVQPVDTVNHYGVSGMEAIRQKKVPREALHLAEGGLVEFGKRIQKLGYDVKEHPLFGGVHPVHTNGSQHYNKRGPGGGGAIDVNADPFNSPFKNEKVAIDKIISMARDYGLRTIWQTAGHFNHAHFDISKNGDMMPAGYKPSSANPGYSGGSGQSLESVLGKLKDKPGPYNQLTASFTAGLLASEIGQVIASGISGGPGDTGAHTKGARANQAIARRLLSKFGWGESQMEPLIKLWNGESGWNEFADNPTSDAYGIPQALPGSKMATEGGDWRTNPETQIRWGLKYIKQRPDYGSPSAAWAKWQSRSPHWYDNGGFLKPGQTYAMNGTGKPEAVLTDQQWGAIKSLAARGVVSADDFRGIGAASGAHVVVNNHQQYTYDQRNDFSGAEIVVQADDPNRMARELETAAVAGRLTQTRGVRRNGG